MEQGTQEQSVVALKTPADDEVFGYGLFVPLQDSVLFQDQSIPTFRLDATSDLLHRLLDSHRPGDVFRLVVSESAGDALVKGLAELTPSPAGGHLGQIRDSSSGRILEHARLVEAAVPFAATPQGMAALITVAAVTELALVLQEAFEVIHNEIKLIQSKLDADQRTRLHHDLATAESALDAARLVERFLREGVSPTSAASLAPHSQAVDTLFLKYRGHFKDLETKAMSFLSQHEDPRADDYLRWLRKLLPYDVYGLRGDVIVFAAAALAKLHVDAVKLSEAQLGHGTLQPVSAHIEVQARRVRESTSHVSDFITELARRDFGSDLKPKGKRPVSGGFLSKMPDALEIQHQLRNIEDLSRRLLAPERLDLGTNEWTEFELHEVGGKVAAKAIVHRESARPIKSTGT